MPRPTSAIRTVDAFAGGDTAALADMAGPAAAALLAAVLAQRSEGSWEQAGDRISRALAAPPASPDLTACLMGCAVRRALAMGAVDEASQLARRLHGGLKGLRHPQAVAVVHRMAHAVAMAQGDLGAARAAAEAGMAASAKPGDLWLEFATKLVRGALAEEDLAPAERILPEIEAHAPAARRCGFEPERLRSTLDILSGHPERVVERRRGSATPADLITLEAMLHAGRFEEADALLAGWAGTAADPHCPGPQRDRLRFMLRLGRMHAAICQRRPAEARSLAMEASRGLEADPAVRDYLLQLLVHAELCLGGITRARAQLQALDPDRRRAPLRMEWARLLLAEGDEAGAGAVFARLVAEGPPSRVLAKIRLAHELDRDALARLWLAADRAPEPRPSVPGRRARAPTPGPAMPGGPVFQLVGDGPAMAGVRHRIAALAPLAQPVLVTGETGTGKEIIARLIHRLGRGEDTPFLALNCAAIPDSLAEAELFGHRRGAFTGAEGDRDGLLTAAGGGTVFLDEVNSMSMRLQGVLLRVLESGDFRAVGATAVQRTRARFIVAANTDLQAAVGAGTFRKDLYYRLQGFAIRLPPLRERLGDLPALVRHFLHQVSGDDGLEVAPDLMEAFAAHTWPGNVRELRSAIERLVLLHSGQRRFTRRDWSADGTPPTEPEPEPAAAPASPPPAAPVAGPILVPGPPRARERRRRLLDLFATHPHLYREDAVRELGMSPSTAYHDLTALAAAGLIRRVITSGHLRTSYFVRTAP